MDMKKFLQAVDGASSTAPKADSSDMKKFLSIVESKGPSNRQSVAEQMIVAQYTDQPQPAKKPARQIEKYFESVAQEKQEASNASRQKYRKIAEQIANKMLGEADVVAPTEPVATDSVDTVTVDVPLLIRLLEYAKEDAKTDMDLHNVADKLIELSKTTEVLSMDQYDAIVGDQKLLPAPDQESP